MTFRLCRRLSATVCLAAAAVLATAAAAQRVPTFDVTTSCRQAASRAAPVGSVETCVKLEQEARDHLARQWTAFAPADKSHCLQLSTLGGEPTYSELLTCLELAQQARNIANGKNGNDLRTTGQGAR